MLITVRGHMRCYAAGLVLGRPLGNLNIATHTYGELESRAMGFKGDIRARSIAI